MGNDWTFEAKDRRTGRAITIDRSWQNWGPATDPIHDYDGYFAGDDERLYRTPDGDYVLVWRADQLRQYYECEYMNAAEAKAWFARQDALPGNPFAAQEQSAPTLDNRSYRSLWNFARRVESALERVLYVACNHRYCDDLGLDRDSDTPALGPALAQLDAVIRVISDVDDWINTPNGADELVNTLFAIHSETRSLTIKVGHSYAPLAWNGDFQDLSTLQQFLGREIAGLASIPELECELYAEALSKLQEPAPATAAVDGAAPQAGDVVETPGGDIGIVEWAAYPGLEPASDEAEPATNARPTEAAADALAHNAVAVEPAPESKGALEANGKRLWTKEAAQPIVYAYLQKHPYATAKAIETETGIPDSTVCKTQAWKRRRFKRPKGKRNGQAKRGAVSLAEKVMAMAEKVAGPDVDIEGLIRRCEAEPDFRQTLEDAYEASMADGAAQEQGRRPVA